MSENKIVQACKDSWDGEWVAGVKNADNCSGFVKTVAKAVGVSLVEGVADRIVEHISEKWLSVASGREAAELADAGTLVLAGLKSGDHDPARSQGHVVVVVPGPLYRDKYPKCWGGSTGQAQSKGTKSVGEVWNRKDRDKVAYYRAP